MVDAVSTLAAAATVTDATVKSKADKAGDAFSSDFESFLTLFVAQLENQDPLEPQDSSDFTAQIAQFSQVEQTVNTNKNLESIIDIFQTDNNSSVVNFSGKYVEVIGDSITLNEDGADNTFHYTLETAARQAFVQITDLNGDVVFTGEAIPDAGKNYLTWDGTDMEGNDAPAGRYTVRVNIKDSDGNIQDIATTVRGRVDGVNLDGEPTLVVNGKLIALDDVKVVGEA
jgi:flagellar basal-body rod modification protein FlgD